jgi:hypothetical protein
MTLVGLVAFACGARREAEKHDWAKRSAPDDRRRHEVVLDGEMTRFRPLQRVIYIGGTVASEDRRRSSKWTKQVVLFPF